MDRHSGVGPPAHLRGRPVSGKDAANANEYFEPFLNATTLKNILGYHRSMCEFLHLKPNVVTHFYPKLKANLTSWRAKAVWKKFDLRASHKCYGKGKICAGTRILVIGGGPCGLRTAIEAQLLGAKVVVVEKRDRFSRNNVLHLWPFVIEDLRMLGAKKFFGKFCAGAIDHISIRQLQCILLKVALLLGVEVHTEVSFVNLLEPSATEKTGWRAAIKPDNHPVSQYEFDVIIGADGKRNTLQGFKRKEFRGKLAIAITANFINKKTEAEARVEEISGVAFIFNQKFFKDLLEATRIDLENIVYYKDDTHYFVMTAKKTSLLEKGVMKQDLADTEKLLAPDNVNREKLHEYAREAANFSTNYQMPDLEFAVNHYGQPDVAMFDFTSMYAAEYSSKVIERNGARLLMILVGDSLLEPFWPTGSGCARGFLSSLDAAWAIKSWSSGQTTPLDVLAERESIYRLLAQTTPDNLNKDWKAYTLDPATRYPNLNKAVVLPHQTACLYDTDNVESIDKMKRASLDANTKHDHVSKKRRRGGVDNEVLLSWLTEQLRDHEDITLNDIPSVFKGGKALSAIIHHYRPDLLDYSAIKDNEPAICNQLAMDILDKDLGILPFMTGEEMTNTEDYLAMTTYLTQVYDTFRGEIPHIKHPKLELPEINKRNDFSIKTIKTAQQQIPLISSTQQSRPSSRHKRHADLSIQKPSSMERKQRKRRTLERLGPSVDYDNKFGGIKPLTNTNADEDIASKIKSLEDKWTNPQPVEKKPKDLMRAIGKIETSDWNIQQIEKKILENKLGKPSTAVDKERVPRWSREEFKARQTKMENKRLEKQDSTEAKFADIDKNIKQLDLKLKEGSIREQGQNKVASITEKLVSKTPQEVEKPIEKSSQLKPMNLPVKTGSEFCHFCDKKVYLMERVSAEGRFFHTGCFKCQYCHTQLRLGSYMFDRDGQYGYRFFCTQHYGMPGELPKPTKLTRKPSQKGTRDVSRSPSKKLLSGVAGVDLLDRVQTPERIEFSHLSPDNASSDQEEVHSQMDEDEWTDKNFGASCNELDESDDDSSSSLSTDSDDEDAFDDALEQPITKEGTLKLAERLKKSYRNDGYSSSDNSSYENSSDDSDSETATEGEEEIRARELRKQEVRVEPPVVQTDTGTDTEMVSDESSTESSSEIQNSATEISTDSEFAHDEPTPTRELPAIALNDIHVTKTRGSGASVEPPRRIQVTSSFLQRPVGTAPHPAPPLLKTAPYALNRTQSTGGIAAKVSLELKKRYLLGEGGTNSIQKSGSASALDSKFKSFQSTISDCQRMLKPAVEPSASMQLFCSKLEERLSPGSTVPPPLPPPDITITTITEQSFADTKSNKTRNSALEHPPHPLSLVEPLQSSDSLSSASSEEAPTTPNFRFDSIPRVEVHAAKESDREDMALDSLCMPSVAIADPIKSVGSEKKTLNQPKPLPGFEHFFSDIHKALHVKVKSDKEESPEDNKSIKTVSGKSSPDGTAALTETELSDWARDENVSDSIELDLSQGSQKKRVTNLANLSEFEEAVNEHVCGKDSRAAVYKNILISGSNDLDSIEYMDTGTETSSEDGIQNSQDGYILFRNEDDLAEDSLNPHINEILETKNVHVGNKVSPSDPDTKDIKKIKIEVAASEHKENKLPKPSTEHEEDSLVVVDTGTTTEENTCSDSTVKNITEIANDSDKNRPSLKIENFQKQRLEEKLAKVKAEQALLKEQQQTQKENIENNLQFEEHCQRLQSKVEFGNARDSIDIRKSRRKSKSDSPLKPDLIREEKEHTSPPKDITLDLKPVIPPDVLYKKENIKKERDVNQKLVQEMVMNKMKAENKSLERKRRNRTNLGSLSPCRPYVLQKSNTTDVVSQINMSNLDKSNKNDSVASSIYATPDLLSNSMASQTARTASDINSSTEKYETPMTSTPPKQHIPRPLSVFSETHKRPSESSLTTSDNYSMPDIRRQLFVEDFKTPKAPPRYNRPSIIRTTEKLKEDARARARLLSNEDLGLSPEDKLNKLREKVAKKVKGTEDHSSHVLESIESLVLNTERRNSLLYSNDTLTKKRNNSFRRSMSGDSEIGSKGLFIADARPKSISEIPKKLSVSKSKHIETDTKKTCKSDPNLLDTQSSKKKSKDRERRKSITKLIAGIFTKKSPTSNGSKGLFAKLSPKAKTTSKSLSSLDLSEHDIPLEEPMKRKSLSENNIEKREVTPPPIPPLPANYIMKATDESSDGENICWKHTEQGSCDTLDQSINIETSSLNSRRSVKAKKASRQAQLKRHRMAQEIQRKLEETEVKTRELEHRGVEVEKALRGESDEGTSKDDSELFQEWFDLMRDKTELRRYEKELMVRAQELELEDRHARLQAELRERLETGGNKTDEDIKFEKNIIKEMMDIVRQRDSLINVLEEDRERYTNEDKDMEEQMLAKGLMLTPIRKSAEK